MAAKETSRPIDTTTDPSNDYLATQILTEYLRWYLPTADGLGVDAIRYRSAFDGEANRVFFHGPDGCGPRGSGWPLELSSVTYIQH